MGAFKSTVLVCNLLGVRNTTDRVTEEEIRLMIQESARDGDVQEVERIFNLGDRDLESIMTPRGEILYTNYIIATTLRWVAEMPNSGFRPQI